MGLISDTAGIGIVNGHFVDYPKQKKQIKPDACLYIVPVPIGNLGDITLRAIDILREVDFVIAEDTRRSLKLLNHLGIQKTILSYYKPREKEKSTAILKRLETQSAALISDSGTPLISDPGLFLIEQAIERHITIIPLPGPTAFVPALVASGLPTGHFLFIGFPPRREGELLSFFETQKKHSSTLIFYESPRRVGVFFKSALKIFGDRPFAICKELSKINETFIRGKLSDWEELTGSTELRGEMVILIHGFTDEDGGSDVPELNSLDDIYQYFKRYNIPKRKIKEIIWGGRKK